MMRYFKGITKKVGTPIHIGVEQQEPVRLFKVNYDAQHVTYDELSVSDVAACPDGSVMWLDVRGIHDIGITQSIGVAFNLHPLLLEDVSNAAQLPKIEELDGGGCLLLQKR